MQYHPRSFYSIKKKKTFKEYFFKGPVTLNGVGKSLISHVQTAKMFHNNITQRPPDDACQMQKRNVSS